MRHAFYSSIDRHQRSIVDWPLTSSPLGRVRIDSSRLSFPFSATMAAIAKLNNWMTIRRFALIESDWIRFFDAWSRHAFFRIFPSLFDDRWITRKRSRSQTQSARGYAIIRLYRNILLPRVNCLFLKRVSRSTDAATWWHPSRFAKNRSRTPQIVLCVPQACTPVTRITS